MPNYPGGSPSGVVGLINLGSNLYQAGQDIYSAASADSGGSGGGTGYVGGGGGGTSVDQAILDQYDQAINRTNKHIGFLGDELDSGYSSIDSSYENAINQLLRSRNIAEEGYKGNKQQTATDFVGSKNTIGANAGRSLSGLQRLLGSRGAGGGSAARIVAPDAVAREATIQRQGVTSQFGQNNQALDTNWNNYLGDYENQRSGAAQQRVQARESLKRTIDANRSGLLEVLAELQAKRATAAGGNAVEASQPYLDRADAYRAKVANYRVDPIKYQTKAYEAPDLEKYTVNPNATPQYEGQASGNDYYSPYLAALLGKKKQSGLAA